MQAEPKSPSKPEKREEKLRSTEVREILAVFVLSVTAILTAWCGFESSKWGGEMSINFSQASAARIKSSDASSEARDARSIDLAIYAQWIDARATGDTALESYVEERFTPEFAVAFADWERDGEQAKSPFAEPSYVPAGQVQAQKFSDEADQKFASALVSNQRGDNYSLLTVLFALVLFFSAMSSRNRFLWVDWVLLGLAIALATTGCVILATFPILV
ncbi:hypothetical protein B0I08_10863 [Glaciihabitans tibetensis]|uniref:DUF4337 domain-containing protein n=1 Tax=Glaciihabitans tibetensis TaxID=1266600 RepID=A0A2T0V9V9_9MICO|nr:hypothetical protein [Glaciihabitans tibetensis]PRY66979.1 hypothetical protein B0I08_10863 [Glaciihabitans tibetensis]